MAWLHRGPLGVLLVWLLVGSASSEGAKNCRPPHPLKSRLVLYQNNKAGLGDRMYIFAKMGNLAASVGALLAVTPPHTLLSPSHNLGQEVNRQARWSDYCNVVFHDGTPALTEIDPVVPRGVVQLNGPLNQAYEKAVALYRDNVTFLWHVHGDYYQYRNPLQKHVLQLADETPPTVSNMDQGLCSYCQSAFSRGLQAKAKRFMVDHQLVPGCFLSMHLRRGDIVGNPKECNNSVPRVQSHVKCALRNLLDTNMTIVLFSNGDSKYIQEAIQAIGVVYSGRVFHGDPYLAASGDDNFAVYVMGHYVRSQAFAMLSMNRWWCDPCPPPFKKAYAAAQCNTVT